MISVKNVHYFHGEKPALKGVSLKVRKGEFVAVVGENGAGKTTLVKHLNGLLLPKKGTVSVEGLDTKENDWEVKKTVGVVFQNPEDQLVNSIVEEDVAFGLENLGVPQTEICETVEETLETLGIEKLTKENVNALSFGQKQLVALAGVLAMRPDYVILDEPTAMLDPLKKARLTKILKELNELGTAIILVTNNLNDVQEQAKRVVVLKNGRVLFDGKTKKLSKKVLKKAGLHD